MNRAGGHPLFSVKTNPVTPGSLTVDSLGSRIFVVVHPLEDSCYNAPEVNPELAVYDIRTNRVVTLALGVNVSLRYSCATVDFQTAAS